MKLLYSLLPILASSLAADLCNPTKGSCDADKALGASIIENFSSESEAEKYFVEKVSNGVSYSSDGVRFRVAKKGDNPSIQSNFYMMFGKVEAVMKAAPGRGIVSSFFLQSDDLDEIDIELLGADTQQWQSNFFSKGNTDSYDRGEFHNSATSLVDEYHTYTLEFTQDAVTFALDGTVMRTLDPGNPKGFPQTPVRIFAGAWAGGDPSNEAGTIEWAGGETDYSQGPFDMHIKSIIAVDYSSGSEYKYGDETGDWSSIEAVDGKVNGRKTQAQEDFKKLQDGESVGGSTESSAVSSAVSSATSSAESSTLSSAVSSTKSSTQSSSTQSSSAQPSSTQPSSTSSAPSDSADSIKTSLSAERTTLAQRTVASTLVTSATSETSSPTHSVAQASSGAALKTELGFCVFLFTFIGYWI